LYCSRHTSDLAASQCTVCATWNCALCAPVHPLLGGPVCPDCWDSVVGQGGSGAIGTPALRRLSSAIVLVAALVFALAAWRYLDRDGVEQRAYLRAYDGLEQVGHALEEFRLREGDYPASLQDLVPDDLNKVPVDPFARGSRALRYSASGLHKERRVLYSVGPDGEDHGGLVRDPISGQGDLLYPVD
jgi:hypothetical protein